MIEFTNIKKYSGLPFEDYLRLPGASNSFLKSERDGFARDFTPTEIMQFGSLCDGILTDPQRADLSHPLYAAARETSYLIHKQFGGMIKYFHKQVSYTADARFSGYVLPMRFRPDFLLPGNAIIDLKITRSKDIPGIIDFMGYKDQVWNYAKVAGVTAGYILIHSVPLKKTKLISVDCSDTTNQKLEVKILKFGNIDHLKTVE